MGRDLGIPYIKSYKAYSFAKKKSLEIRKEKELKQKEALKRKGLKILLAGHPYNLYDELIGKDIINYIEQLGITIIYSDRIPHNLIDSECKKLSTDIYWTHSKEVVASVNYYKDKVNGIILLSSFPCGPDSLSNDLICRRVKNIPVLNLLFEDLNSNIGLLTRLESFFDILKQKEELYEKSN
jgi:predicted nucleotide-binding protein (sugar kinase/HSP70/actin superfamily)